jgi:MFS family permease
MPASIREATISFFPPEVANATPQLLRWLALAWSIHVIIAICLITRRPEVKEEEENTNVQVQEDDDLSVGSRDDKGPRTFKEGLLSKSFLSIYLMMFIGNYFGTYFSYTFKIYGLHEGLSDNMLTWAGATSSISNGICRIIFGYLVDVVGFKPVFYTLLSILTVVSLICTDAVHFPILYFMCLVLNISAMGSVFAVLPPATLRCFGMKYGPYLYTVVPTATLLTALTNIGNASLIPVITMRGVCAIGTASLLLGYIVVYTFNESPVWLRDEMEEPLLKGEIKGDLKVGKGSKGN